MLYPINHTPHVDYPINRTYQLPIPPIAPRGRLRIQMEETDMPQSDFQTLAAFLANPGARFHPAMAADAWAMAKELRGQPIDELRMSRLNHAQHVSAPHGLVPAPALIARIRARAASIGRTGPTPLILLGSFRRP